MNRNVESHFSELPSLDIQRSRFDRSSSHKTSFDAGMLIPFYVDEVVPGDTFDVTTSAVVRLQTPINPIMDNIYMDTYYFFVPNRLVWSHWKEFMGENSSSAWIPSTKYTIPTIKPPNNGWNVGTIADYMGIPTGVFDQQSIMYRLPSAIPFRAYALIADQWFRDQNLTDPLVIPTGDSQQTGTNGSSYITDVANGGAPFKVAKYHDYFTSCTPAPLKHDPIGLWGNSIDPNSPNFSSYVPVVPLNDTAVPSGSTQPVKARLASGGTAFPLVRTGSTGPYPIGQQTANTQGGDPILISNLFANVGLMNLSINELRLAFQLQKYYEKQARAGSRYREILKEMFNVTSSDARMMIPEYLGGHRFPLSIHQVANTADSSSASLGDLGAMSNTSDVHSDFIKSFEEHGYVIGVCCVRYDHSYPQGLERFWTRKLPEEFYLPVFANIGEQPVYKSEIFWTNATVGTEVFGYQEPWADYRYKPSRTSGEMRPGVVNSLATWHLADYYASSPSLSDAWIREDKTNIDRVLTVTSAVSHQIFADFYIQNYCTRPMPVYSIPGLIDHH